MCQFCRRLVAEPLTATSSLPGLWTQRPADKALRRHTDVIGACEGRVGNAAAVSFGMFLMTYGLMLKEIAFITGGEARASDLYACCERCRRLASLGPGPRRRVDTGGASDARPGSGEADAPGMQFWRYSLDIIRAMFLF